ncbi:TIGR02453 family protein [Pseudonocardia sp. CNS-139]|nr:TIGR02453 family protein [Pseudonocardia sp. CNS-139]
MTVPATFSGFGEGAVEFYDGLEADNSKAYWTDRRDVYEQDVKAPMLALLAALEPEFGPGKVFRPYRDVRFAADKSPYKTHCGAVAGPFYVEVGPRGLVAAGGYYQMAPDQVARFRTAVAEDRRGTELERLLDTLTADGLTVAGERLRTRPRGYDADHPRIDLLRHKGIYGSRVWPPDDVLHEPGALDRVATAWRALTPLVEWLADHVGRSDQPRR